MNKTVFLLPVMAILWGCSHKTSDNTTSSDGDAPVPIAVSLPPAAFMPKATAIKIDSRYADKVAVTLDGSGKLSYFPAPSDISASSAPLELCGGWWLNRQGISENSVFTTYTFAEYAALKEVPSPQQLIQAVIPGSGVEEMMQLPFTISEAQGHLDDIRKIVCPQ